MLRTTALYRVKKSFEEYQNHYLYQYSDHPPCLQLHLQEDLKIQLATRWKEWMSKKYKPITYRHKRTLKNWSKCLKITALNYLVMNRNNTKVDPSESVFIKAKKLILCRHKEFDFSLGLLANFLCSPNWFCGVDWYFPTQYQLIHSFSDFGTKRYTKKVTSANQVDKISRQSCNFQP